MFRNVRKYAKPSVSEDFRRKSSASDVAKIPPVRLSSKKIASGLATQVAWKSEGTVQKVYLRFVDRQFDPTEKFVKWSLHWSETILV